MRKVREVTNKIYEAVEEGVLSWQQVGEAALRALSEDEVAQMAHNEEFFMHEDEEDDEALDEEHRDSHVLADLFDEYIYDNDRALTQQAEWGVEDGGTRFFAEEISDNGFTTIRECIEHFCK